MGEDWNLKIKQEDLSANEDWIQEELVKGEREGSKRKMFVCECCPEEFESMYKLLKHTSTCAFNCARSPVPFADCEQFAEHKLACDRKKLRTADSLPESLSCRNILVTKSGTHTQEKY